MNADAMRHAFALLPLIVALLGTNARAQPAEGPALPDTFEARVEALASMMSLDAALLGSRSATATLEAWCASHALADPPKVRAMRVAGPEQPPSEAQRRRLAVGPDEPVRHRRVRLGCGDRALSEADNWYVPSRLTPAMNATLDSTDTPYGKVVAPLSPTRRTFEATVLWRVLPDGWERHLPREGRDGQDNSRQNSRGQDGAGGSLAVPPVLFEHRALVLDSGGRPLAEVDERYLAGALDFARQP